MTRMDAEQHDLLSRTLREVLSGPAAEVDTLLEQLGWDEVVAEDPATATTLLFTEHGRTLAAGPLLDRVVLTALGAEHANGADAICYPDLRPDSAIGDGPTVSGVLLGRPAAAARVLVPLRGTDGPAVVVLAAGDLEVRPVRTFDPSLDWFAVSGSSTSPATPAPTWPDALAAGRRAIAAELIGLAEEVLRLAVEHTSARHQFGAPIAAFQAVRHRLAEGYVAIAAARSLLAAAFDDGSPMAAVAAKAQAGRAHEQVSAHALQVCGAMGSSLEHPLHRFVSRGTVLDALLGGWSGLVRELGHGVHSTGLTPHLVEV